MRPSKDKIFLAQAALAACRGTCIRRRVGCVLVDRGGYVLSTGYNGPPAGATHCTDDPSLCEGAGALSGVSLDGCRAIHAEQNALLQCSNVWDIHYCYTTTAPCVHCTKLLLNTGCRIICFLDPYAKSNAKKWWEDSGRAWYQFSEFNGEPIEDVFQMVERYGAQTQGR